MMWEEQRLGCNRAFRFTLQGLKTSSTYHGRVRNVNTTLTDGGETPFIIPALSLSLGNCPPYREQYKTGISNKVKPPLCAKSAVESLKGRKIVF